jgi:hypothetical protein
MHKNCRGKLLDCSTGHLERIIVRAKWQSSLAFGDNVKVSLMGNRHSGDAEILTWENLLDLRRSFYSLNDHSPLHNYRLCKR